MPAPARSFRELIGVPASTASTSDSALVIIDAQNEYADGQLKTVNVESTRSAIYGLLQKYRQNGGTVIHVLHDTPSGAPVFTPDTPLSQEFAELQPLAGEKVIHKSYPSSFAQTDLDSYLKEQHKEKIVLTGYMAHVCVSTTARAGAELGYDVVLAREAIGDRDIPGVGGEEVTETVLRELGDAFGTVVGVGEIQ